MLNILVTFAEMLAVAAFAAGAILFFLVLLSANKTNDDDHKN